MTTPKTEVNRSAVAAKKRKGVKARRMWSANLPYELERKMKLKPSSIVVVLDVSDEAALIAQVENALAGWHEHRGTFSGPYWAYQARAVLASLGIIKKARK